MSSVFIFMSGRAESCAAAAITRLVDERDSVGHNDRLSVWDESRGWRK